MSNQAHWDAVYAAKQPTEVSWYRSHLERSLRWIDGLGLGPLAPIVDVGGGASTLADDLLARGFERLTVVDLSARALEHARARLGAAADRVRWRVGDATTPLLDPASVDLWHDRAVFHFLTDANARTAYRAELLRALRPGAHAIVATFAPDGPERCSGLPVVRYTPEALAATLGLELIEHAHQTHVTPSGSTQAFTHALLRRGPT